MKTRETEIGYFYIILDLIILITAIGLMGLLTKSIQVTSFRDLSIYWLSGNLSYIIAVLFFTKTNLFLRGDFRVWIYRILKQTAIFLMVLFSVFIILLPYDCSGLFIAEYTILFLAGRLLFYWLGFNFLKFKRMKGKNTKHAVIVGVCGTSHKLRKIIEHNHIMGYSFVGFIDEKGSGNPNVIGKPDQLEDVIDQYHIEMVFVVISVILGETKLEDYLKICNAKGVRLRIVSENKFLTVSEAISTAIRGMVVINPQEIPLDRLLLRIYKRLFDIVFSSLAILLVFTWLFPILMILVKLSSKGPFFFKQKRTGIDNEIFNCIKFRTMMVNDVADTKQASADDKRITRIGKFMRDTYLDELPQFFNVFIGQMSVVGPRPHMLSHTEFYSQHIENYLVRHYVKPGVTGWAQINGYNGETDELWKMEKRIEYDMYYNQNWTPFLDIKIIWCSVFCVKKISILAASIEQNLPTEGLSLKS